MSSSLLYSGSYENHDKTSRQDTMMQEGVGNAKSFTLNGTASSQGNGKSSGSFPGGSYSNTTYYSNTYGYAITGNPVSGTVWNNTSSGGTGSTTVAGQTYTSSWSDSKSYSTPVTGGYAAPYMANYSGGSQYFSFLPGLYGAASSVWGGVTEYFDYMFGEHSGGPGLDGFIPTWGSGREIVASWNNGNYERAHMNVGYLILDCVAVGGAVRGALVKGATKLNKVGLARTAVKNFVHGPVKRLGNESLYANAKRLANRLGFEACFAAGTPIRTPSGSKPIEAFKVGDLVLSRDEHNAEAPVEAKVVEELFERKALMRVLHLGGQTIRTTAEHPFHRDCEWVNAN